MRETLLTTGAALGVLCVLSALIAPMLGLKLLVFQSGSMSPQIDTGAVAVTRTVDADQLHKGDVVSVRSTKGTRITHRVTAITEQGGQSVLHLKGDANDAVDSEVYPVTKVDRVVAHVNGLGYVVNAIATPYAVFVAGGAAAGLLVLAFRRSGTLESPTSDELAEEDSTDVPDDAVHGERNRRHRRTAVTAGVVIAALGVGTAAWSGIRGGSVVPTLAAFSDTAQVNGSAAALTVPNPTGAINCGTGAPMSDSVNLDWTDVANSSTSLQYRLDFNGHDSGTLTYTAYVDAPKLLVHKSDIGTLGTYDVTLSVSLDGTNWKSASNITRQIWAGPTLWNMDCG